MRLDIGRNNWLQRVEAHTYPSAKPGNAVHYQQGKYGSLHLLRAPRSRPVPGQPEGVRCGQREDGVEPNSGEKAEVLLSL